MRLISWNINGIRTLPLYHPWNALKTGEAILNELGADIICFQEVKSSRQTIDKSVALPDSYDAFFSFPTVKGGYSGVGVFAKSSRAVPLKAEEGLSGRFHTGLKPPLSAEERISQSIPKAHEMDLMDDETTNSHNDLLELDKEGRTLMVDFGLFVLINVYCPNETSDSRLPYKMNFHLLLQERVRLLVEIDKREVIVVGDINVCAAPIDHCDGELPSNKEDFWDHPARKWFHEWLHPLGPMHDIVRECWPDRKGMYTCWNQKIDARTTNYGTRIDYFLLSKGLLPWFKHGDIQPAIKGSDHCPVYIDLHEEIVNEDGQTLHLKDVLKMNGEKRDPPRLATRYWPEYSGKQKLLSSFFGKKDAVVTKSDVSKNLTTSVPSPAQVSNTPVSTPSPVESPDSVEVKTHGLLIPEKREPIDAEDEISVLKAEISSNSFPSNLTASSSPKDAGPEELLASLVSGPLSPAPLKRRKMQADSNYRAPPSKKSKKCSSLSKTKEATSSQKKLSSFFTGPASQSQEGKEGEQRSPPQSQKSDIIDVDSLLAAGEAVFRDVSRPSPPLTVSGSSQPTKGKNSHSWTTLFKRVEPPKCVVHGEPAREFTVNKPGLNKGKAFFICARPVGPGYDAGKDKRRREEVDSQYRCNFFKWSSDVKKEALREAELKNGKY